MEINNPFFNLETGKITKIRIAEANPKEISRFGETKIHLQFCLEGPNGSLAVEHPSENFDFYFSQGGQFHPLKARCFFNGSCYSALLNLEAKRTYGQAAITVKNAQLKLRDQLSIKVKQSFKSLNLLYIVDDSESMERNDPKRQRYQSLLNLIEQTNMQKHIQELAVISFNSKARIMLPFVDMDDFMVRKYHLYRNYTAGTTDIPEALDLAKKLLRNKISGNTQIIFLTDGKSTVALKGEDEALIRLGLPVHTIGLHQGNNKEYEADWLKKLSQRTKGRFLEGGDFQLEELLGELLTSEVKKIPEFMIQSFNKNWSPTSLVELSYRSPEPYSLEILVDEEPLLSYSKKSDSGYYRESFFPPNREPQITTIIFKNKQHKIIYKRAVNINWSINENLVDLRRDLSKPIIIYQGRNRLSFSVFASKASDISLALDAFHLAQVEIKPNYQWTPAWQSLDKNQSSVFYLDLEIPNWVQGNIDSYLLLQTGDSKRIHNISFRVERSSQEEFIAKRRDRFTLHSGFWIIALSFTAFLTSIVILLSTLKEKSIAK